MKHYVIAIDFSENALMAVKFALSLARKKRVSLSLVHAYQPFYSGMQTAIYFSADEERAEQQAERQMKQFLQKLQRLALYSEDDPLIQAVCINGQWLRALSRFHQANEIDLLIIGVGNVYEDKAVPTWSVIHEISKEIPVPILVVPYAERTFNLDHIAFFTHFTQEDKLVLSFLISIFGTTKVNYRLLSLQMASKERNDNEQLRLAKWAAVLCSGNEDIKLSVELGVGREIVELVDGIGHSEIDIFVLTRSNQYFWKQLTGTGLAKELVLQAQRPLLIFN